MTIFEWLKLVHVSCAVISICGFALRGLWMLKGNPLLQNRLVRVLPHTVDTLLLGTAVAMLYQWRVSPLQYDWLMAKITALLLYIGLGMVAMRFGRTRSVRRGAYLLALLSAAYIVSVAYTKSVLGVLVLLTA